MSYVNKIVKLADNFIKTATDDPKYVVLGITPSGTVVGHKFFHSFEDAEKFVELWHEKGYTLTKIVERGSTTDPDLVAYREKQRAHRAKIDDQYRASGYTTRPLGRPFDDENDVKDKEPESKELLHAALKANQGHGMQIYYKGQHFGWYKWDAKNKKHKQFSIGNYNPKDTIGELEEDLSKCPKVTLEDFLPSIAGRKQI